jgi:hypothetical protein
MKKIPSREDVNLAISYVVGIPVKILVEKFLFRTIEEIQGFTRGLSPWELNDIKSPGPANWIF